MNAQELADQLDNVKYQNGAKPFEMYATMLRQQADRIAELEKQTKPLSDADIQQISHRYHYTYNPDYVGFAKAIEERHGIK